MCRCTCRNYPCAVSTPIVRCTWGAQVLLNVEEFFWYVHKYKYKLFHDSIFSSVRRYLRAKKYVKIDMVHA
jgi:hypothetical protein